MWLLGGVFSMNPYKLRALLEFVRRERAAAGVDIKEVADVVAWFGLDVLLSPSELRVVKEELTAVLEAEAFIDRLRLSVLR